VSDQQTEHVLDLARERIAARHAEQAQHQEVERGARLHNERPWRFFFLGALGTLLLGLLLAPGLSLNQKLLIVMQGVCSQEHNLFLAGLQLPICARCTGIYLTVVTTLGMLLVMGRGRAGGLPPWHISAALVGLALIMGIDGINSLFETMGLSVAYMPRNDVRSLTGMGMGMGMAVVLLLIFNLSLRADIDEKQPILKNWWEVGGIALLNLLILAAIFGSINLLFWPVAALSVLGMAGALYVVNLVVVAVVLGYANVVTRLNQLARPATLALLPTLLLLGGFAWLRAWLAGKGLAI
jgi:uncharacterized membrane protein